MPLRLGSIAPDFVADSTHGRLHLYDYLDGSWSIIIAYPYEYTPVCTTEMASVSLLTPEIERLNCKVVSLRVDTVGRHQQWIEDIDDITQISNFTWPVVSDTTGEIAMLYDMMDAPVEGVPQPISATMRSLYIVDPRKRVRAYLSYPSTCGRHFDEIIRVLVALQVGDKHNVHTPADWFPGKRVIVPVDVPTCEATKQFGKVTEDLSYLRWVRSPKTPIDP
ncbi:peroxiredoxin [Thamnocephalis sphaerospora]|uniref:Peroxiredoxin n=1 Tax=Thamnocephalis sphaerospora TaxID=78915 RepID=A0A4P9XVK4_9FUNG|nr:peroxiredoxin [Thamnocephalis sphaerospora]|eukprot:RKP10296.1 peroxiredoxin [Thamnocephalis sphaerospora]